MPLPCIVVVLDFGDLCLRQAFEQLFNSFHTFLHWGLFVLQHEQPWQAFALCCDALEFGVFIELTPAVKKLVSDGVLEHLFCMRLGIEFGQISNPWIVGRAEMVSKIGRHGLDQSKIGTTIHLEVLS